MIYMPIYAKSIFGLCSRCRRVYAGQDQPGCGGEALCRREGDQCLFCIKESWI